MAVAMGHLPEPWGAMPHTIPPAQSPPIRFELITAPGGLHWLSSLPIAFICTWFQNHADLPCFPVPWVPSVKTPMASADELNPSAGVRG